MPGLMCSLVAPRVGGWCPASRNRWSRSSSDRCRPCAIEAIIWSDGCGPALPLEPGVVVGRHVAQRGRPPPAADPLVRRRGPRGRPTSSGCNDSRRRRRNSASPGPIDRHAAPSPSTAAPSSYRAPPARSHGSPIRGWVRPSRTWRHGSQAMGMPGRRATWHTHRPPRSQPWPRKPSTSPSPTCPASWRCRHRRQRRDRPRHRHPAGRAPAPRSSCPSATAPRARRRSRRSAEQRPERRTCRSGSSTCRRWPRWRRFGDDAARGGAADPHPDQQRRRDDAARPADHRGRVRAPVRHQPPRPLRPRRPSCCPCCAPAGPG